MYVLNFHVKVVNFLLSLALNGFLNIYFLLLYLFGTHEFGQLLSLCKRFESFNFFDDAFSDSRWSFFLLDNIRSHKCTLLLFIFQLFYQLLILCFDLFFLVYLVSRLLVFDCNFGCFYIHIHIQGIRRDNIYIQF